MSNRRMHCERGAPNVLFIVFRATTMTSQELAHQGSAATQEIGCASSRQQNYTSEMQSESQRSQQTGLRQRKQLRLSSKQHILLVAALLLVCRSDALLLGAPTGIPYGEPGDASLLTRVSAVKEAAHVVKSAAYKWTGQVKKTLHIKETQVRYSTSPRLPLHGNFIHNSLTGWARVDH